jgi:Tol biopolymer transport system component
MPRTVFLLLTMTLTLGPAALGVAAPGDISLASSSDAGTPGNFESFQADISTDGRRVAFESNATNLDPVDTDLMTDIYVKDLASGDVVLASAAPARNKGKGRRSGPTKGNSPSRGPSLSGTGSRVAFDTGSSNLDRADEFGDFDVYVKDLVTQALILASSTAGGVKANGYSQRASISADGTKVVFDSTATNLDPADGEGNFDIYVKDLATGSVRLVSTAASGVKGNGASFNAAISPDGTRVAFVSEATNLHPADGEPSADLFVKDLVTGALFLASSSDGGIVGNEASFGPDLSRDGRVVAFTSRASNLDPTDADVVEDVYLKDLATGDIRLVSSADGGTKGNGMSAVGSVSADGRLVAFSSLSTNLDPADPDLFGDVFLKDVITGDLTLISVTAGGVKGNGDSGGGSVSADAARVAFSSTATNLHPSLDGRSQVLVKER